MVQIMAVMSRTAPCIRRQRHNRQRDRVTESSCCSRIGSSITKILIGSRRILNMERKIKNMILGLRELIRGWNGIMKDLVKISAQATDKETERLREIQKSLQQD
jgi:hypothetical protein